MSKSANPEWILSENWGVSRDPYNWILKARKGNRWTAITFHATPEALLKTLQSKIALTTPAQPDLIRHLQTAFEAAQAAAAQFSEQLRVALGVTAKTTPRHAYATINQGVPFNAS